MSGKVKPEAAYVEEEDDNGKTIRRQAKRQDDINAEKASSERKTARKVKEKQLSDSRRSKTDNSSPSPPPVRKAEPSSREEKQERRKSSSSTKSPKKSSSRPPSVHKNATFAQPIEIPPPRHTQPVVIQNPHHRALTHNPRPSSFHEGMAYPYAPGLSYSPYYPAPNSLVPVPSYPPPSPGGTLMTYGNGVSYSNSGNSRPPGFRQDYFSPVPQPPSRTLVERLGGAEPKARRRLSTYSTDERGYESSRDGVMPRKSSLRKTKEQRDMELMPPPPRRRGSVRYADEEPLIDERLYESRPHKVYRDEESPHRRPSNNRHSASYTLGTRPEIIELERKRGRRNSYYPPRTTPYPYEVPVAQDWEDQLKEADKYMNSVGGPTPRLTAHALKKASRRAHPPSSHSTRSSASRDESERQRSSVTTRTTGTNAGEEDITIKLKGKGKIEIAGAKINYDKDTELNIHRGPNANMGSGSQRSSDFTSSDEMRGRRERASELSRLSSRYTGSRYAGSRESYREPYHPGGVPSGMF